MLLCMHRLKSDDASHDDSSCKSVAQHPESEGGKSRQRYYMSSSFIYVTYRAEPTRSCHE